MENSLEKKIIEQIFLFNFFEKRSKKKNNIGFKVYNIENEKKIRKIISNTRKNNCHFFTIYPEKIKKNIFFKIFLNFLFSNVSIYKNTFIFYKFKTEIRGESIFPLWPGSYKEINFFKCLYIWIKKFLYIIFYFKKIELILIKI